MTSQVIRADSVGKQYRIGAMRSPGPGGLGARALRRLAAPLARARAVLQGRLAESSEDVHWALRDVSFSVRRGEVLGLVGANGSGKSTMLRILSGITLPTTGRVAIHGQVGSLLETAVGFHPELTGRENVKLYGTMMGLSRHELRGRMDRIVAHAGVSRFLDTQLKFFSPGMVTRLAFSVALAVEPDILLVDEVLSVSDVAFQQESLSQIARAGREGRTVIFVSHQLQTVRALCHRCLLLEDGQLAAQGATDEVIGRFLASHRGPSRRAGSLREDPSSRPGSGEVRITAASLKEADPGAPATPERHVPLRLRLAYRVNRPVPGLHVTVGVRARTPFELVASARRMVLDEPLAPGQQGEITLEAAAIPLKPGTYPLSLALGHPSAGLFDLVDDGSLTLTVAPAGTGARPDALPDPGGHLDLEMRVFCHTSEQQSDLVAGSPNQ